MCWRPSCSTYSSIKSFTLLYLVMKQLNYKIDGKLFRRSGCKLPLKMTITELRFADDLMATCHSQSLLQDFINRFTKAAKTWGLEVSTTKSKVMIQQSGLPSTPASFFINDNQIEVVPPFPIPWEYIVQ